MRNTNWWLWKLWCDVGENYTKSLGRVIKTRCRLVQVEYSSTRPHRHDNFTKGSMKSSLTMRRSTVGQLGRRCRGGWGGVGVCVCVCVCLCRWRSGRLGRRRQMQSDVWCIIRPAQHPWTPPAPPPALLRFRPSTLLANWFVFVGGVSVCVRLWCRRKARLWCRRKARHEPLHSQHLQCVGVCCGVLRCVTAWYSVSQCVAVWRSALQCGAVRCSAVQRGAVWCSVMQCGAVWCASSTQGLLLP